MIDIIDLDEYLYENAVEEDGTYLRLRMGEDPGDEQIQKLRTVLQLIFNKYEKDPAIPRRVAMSCGAILHFASECNQNLNASGAPQKLHISVMELQLAAFKILVGDAATEWGFPKASDEKSTNRESPYQQPKGFQE